MLNLFYGLQHGRRKLGLIANACAATLIFFLLYTATKNESAQSYTKDVIGKLYGDKGSSPSPSSNYDLYTLENIDLSHLNKHELSENFFYTRRVVNSKHVVGERKSLSNVHQSLFKQSSKVANKDLERFQRRQDLPLELDISVPQSVSGGKTLSFGIATPIERLLDSLPQLMHWLPNTGAMLHVISPADPRTKNVTEHIRSLGINITIVESYDRFPINYFSLLPLLYHTRLPSTKWLALIDDDTFVPDLGSLISHLEERYNPKLPQIISGVSDDIVQIRKHGLMPFGGGGIFTSVPFAAIIVDNNYPGTAGSMEGGHFPTPPNPYYTPFGPPMESPDQANWVTDPNSPYRHSIAYKQCLATEKFEGDQILNECINKQTNVRPQYDVGLHQMDLRGDISGFFESGRRSLTLHHWKTWFHVDIPSVASVTKICGKDCFLQRFHFPAVDSQRDPDEEWVLNNGYSITKYPNGVKGLVKDIPAPPPPPPPAPEGLPDPTKDTITANPRFLRQDGEWIQWPDLGLGEEVVYEGVMGVIVDKTMMVGGLPDKKLDPYKGFGNLVWVPMNQPFGKTDGAVPVVANDELREVDAAPEKTEEKKDEEAKTPSENSNEAPSDGSAETLSKDTSQDMSRKESVKTDAEPAAPANAKDEISHFQRFKRTLSDLTTRDPQGWISAAATNNITDIKQLNPEERQAQEDELEDIRRFWTSIEKTWDGEADRFAHAMGPLRRQVKTDEEVIRFLMVESVGGWGDPGKQDIENVKDTLAPQKFIKGFEGDPDKKLEKIHHGGQLMAEGDPGFEGLWGPDPPPPPPAEAPKEARAIGGGSVISTTPRSARSSKRWWTPPSLTTKLGMSVGMGEAPESGGMGGINRPSVDWVRQTYIRKGLGINGDRIGEDEVIELIWMR